MSVNMIAASLRCSAAFMAEASQPGKRCAVSARRRNSCRSRFAVGQFLKSLILADWIPQWVESKVGGSDATLAWARERVLKQRQRAIEVAQQHVTNCRRGFGIRKLPLIFFGFGKHALHAAFDRVAIAEPPFHLNKDGVGQKRKTLLT